MELDIKTLEIIKNKIQDKIDNSKSNKGFYSDEAYAFLDGKELAFEEIIDLVNELLK